MITETFYVKILEASLFHLVKDNFNSIVAFFELLYMIRGKKFYNSSSFVSFSHVTETFNLSIINVLQVLLNFA